MNLLHTLYSLFFPRICPLCQTVLEDNEVLCSSCMELLPRTEQQALRGNMTEEKFASDTHFQRGAAFLFFDKESDIQFLFHAIKYSDRPDLAYALAKEASFDFMQADFFDEIDVIIPIPLHPKRLRQRGYNQSEYIAKAISDTTHIPMDTTHIERVVNNPKQALKYGKERDENVRGIFRVNHPEEMYHKHILLVDDIITTGATIRSCMESMHTFKGCQINVFALGKTR